MALYMHTPLLEALGKEYTSTIIWFSLWGGMKFTVIFLNFQTLHPRINAVCNVYFQLVLVCGAISLIKQNHISIIWVSIFAAFTFLLILTTSFYSWWKGNEGAKFFFCAWSCNGFGLLVYAAVALKISPATWYTIASAPIGVMLEAVVLSFALADRIKRVRQKALDADEMVVENMSKYRSVFDNALEGMYKMTVFGKIDNANRSLAKAMGYSNIEKMLENSSQVSNSLFGNNNDNYQKLIKKGKARNDVTVKRDGFPPMWIINNAKLIYSDTGEGHHIEGTVNSLSESFSERAKNKSLDFEIDIIYPIPNKIKGDPTRILQVANNLCSNAIRRQCS